MNKTLIAGALIASLAAGTAAAQMKNEPAKDNSAPPPPESATTPEIVGNANQGFVMTKAATQPVQFSRGDSGNLMTSNLIGTEVYNKKDEHVGEIVDVAIDQGKTVSGVVLSVGGFLGIGERHVLVQPQSVAVVKDGNSWKAYIDTSKESLKDAPKFEYRTARKS